MTLRLYVWQRLSAAVMVPLIAIHLGIIFMVSGSELTAADILARTKGSILWGSYYTIFVLAAAIHGAIGLRTVLGDWTPINHRFGNMVMWVFGLGLMSLGLRAVYGVTWP